jgi:protein-S-isoprenylcysteine O-methyltransferase Ste14
MTTLNTKAWLRLAVLAIVMGLLPCVPAWTVHYWQARGYLAIFTGTSILTTRSLMRHDPALLARRMRAGPTAERQPAQGLIRPCTSIGFIALLVVPALDVRLGRSAVPLGGVVAGDVLVVTGVYCIPLAYRESTLTSAAIEVAEGQQVISTGPSAIVRHPMYASASLYLLGTPLALGSSWGLVVPGALVPLRLWRLFDEARCLAKNLPGYPEYRKRVRHRLVPFVW